MYSKNSYFNAVGRFVTGKFVKYVLVINTHAPQICDEMIILTVVLWQIVFHRIQQSKFWDFFQFCIFVKKIEKMERCAICNEKAPFKCTACKMVNYCGAEHQKKDWPNHKINCRPFKIEQSDELGRYLVATRDIPAQSLLFIESPLVIGVCLWLKF